LVKGRFATVSVLRPVFLLAGAVALAAPIAAAVLLRPGTSGAQAAAAPVAPSVQSVRTHPGFPSPPRGAVVFARQLGHDALALGVVPQQGQVLAQASVVSQQGVGVTGLRVSFAVGGATRAAVACGPGCYRATVPVAGRPAVVVVSVGLSARWGVAMPAAWPARDAGAIVLRAGNVWRSLRSLSFSETLGSGTGVIVASNWQLQAPDRLAYQVKQASDAVIVGPRRWDRVSANARWIESPQSPLAQPVPPWVSVTDAHILGMATVRGRPVWRISFFDPGTPAWFVVTVDRATMRTYDQHMVATAHFMHDVYTAFNATAPIQPPR
jgi:hypothetical protein